MHDHIPIRSASELLAGYERGEFEPIDVLNAVQAKIVEQRACHAWITEIDRADISAQIEALPRRIDQKRHPLYGIPFAVKDNIDVAGYDTTAGCPAFAYRPDATAPVVKNLQEAGAIVVAKTNMSQFAIGLAGERSPYGAPQNPYGAEYAPGGSSSGSAVAVASGAVTFSLGTDTAGSGRVPAAFNNVVGFKPSQGVLSTRGIVPCCSSLDCVSIFANDVRTCETVFEAANQPDPLDIFRRDPANYAFHGRPIRRLGVLSGPSREFFGDRESEANYQRLLDLLPRLGFDAVEVEFSVFREVGAMLYDGPWMAERDVAVGAFIRANPDAVIEISRDAILSSVRYTAADAFRAFHRLKALSAAIERRWESFDALLLPTTPTVYTLSEVEREAAEIPNRLGIYTNFVNLLGLCAIAIPNGFVRQRIPVGVSLVGKAFDEAALATAATTLMSA